MCRRLERVADRHGALSNATTQYNHIVSDNTKGGAFLSGTTTSTVSVVFKLSCIERIVVIE